MGVAKVDDAAIVNRAKELCEQDGVAWNRLSATTPGARVLNDRGRRECLMRARNELMREADLAGEPGGNNGREDVIGAAVEVTQVPNGENSDDPQIPPAESAASRPTRRVA
jgi:hypothetical protein